MPVKTVDVEGLLALSAQSPVLDVRSPGEYGHAHIPGALSLPLFSDEERARIGTAYKQESRETAIKIGLDVFGAKMRGMVEEVERLLREKQGAGGKGAGRTVVVHCWRGGMRSAAVAWLLDLYGFEVNLLEGGYKAYRQWVIRHWEDKGLFQILDGKTGSGKTRVLRELERMGQPVLDLEGIAQHKGSAFGGLDEVLRPKQEMFENLLGMMLHELREKHGEKAIWVEHESQRIGDVNIPRQFFKTMMGHRQGVFLNVPFEQRLSTLVEEYGGYPLEKLINAIVRIKKRLGPLETKTALAELVEGNTRGCFEILLKYYDKHYYAHEGSQHIVEGGSKSPQQIAALIMNCTI